MGQIPSIPPHLPEIYKVFIAFCQDRMTQFGRLNTIGLR